MTFNQVVRGSSPRCFMQSLTEARKEHTMYAPFYHMASVAAQKRNDIGGYGGIGRRDGFRSRWATVQVRVLLAAS